MDQNLSYSGLLRQKGFPSYLWTEFLSALTDNLYKMVITFLITDMALNGLGPDDQSFGLAVTGALFVSPFLFFAGWGGYFADHYPKRNVLVNAKMAEFFALFLASAALYTKNFYIMMAALFILMIKSAFFSPAKYGIIPEITTPHQISRANGLVQMSTFVAIIMGSILAGVFSSIWGRDTIPVSILLICLGAFGWWVSRFIPTTPIAKAKSPFPRNPWREIVAGLRRLKTNRILRISCWGSFWFWMTAVLCQTNLILLGKDHLILEDFLNIKHLSQTLFNHPIVNIENFYIALLGTFMAFGIGSGGAMAGFLSGDKVELGLMPIGALGIGVGSLYLSYSAPDYFHCISALMIVGFFCGFFMVPLNAFIQTRSGEAERGRIIATQAFFDTSGMFVGSALYFVLQGVLGLTPPYIFMLIGFATLGVTIYVIRLMPIFLIRLILWVLIHTLYRIRVVGRENVPITGPALLVANHTSYMDGLLITAVMSKNIRFLVYGNIFKIRPINWLFQKLRIIPIRGGKDIIRSIDRARAALLKNEIVGIFAEGELTRTGNMLPFKRGFEKIVDNLPKTTPIIPIYLDGLWNSIFSFEGGKFFFKIPRFRRLDVTLVFGDPLPPTTTAWELRQEITALGTDAVERRRKSDVPLGMQLIQIGRRHWFKNILGDIEGKVYSYGRLIIKALTLSSYFKKTIKNQKVGVYLENGLQKAVVNIALNFAGKTTLNLDPHVSFDDIKSTLDEADVKDVITTKALGGNLFERAVFLEKLPKVRSSMKLFLHTAAFICLPSRLSFRFLCDYNIESTTPVSMIKENGKMLTFTHSQILAQTQSLNQIFFNKSSDLMFSKNSFETVNGLISSLWLPLFSGLEVVYGNDENLSGDTFQNMRVNFFFGFSKDYETLFENSKPFQLAHLNYAVLLDNDLDKEPFESKFGVEILKGLSIPELGGLVTLNHKSYVAPNHQQIAKKDGTQGQPLPGVAAKIMMDQTELFPGQKGLLYIKTTARSQGTDSWYNTGLQAEVDESGFVSLI